MGIIPPSNGNEGRTCISVRKLTLGMGIHAHICIKKYPIMKAIWNGTVLAESDQTKMIEGNYYFPMESINKEFFQPSDTHTTCFWKGEASYFTIKVGENEMADGAWYYPKASPAAAAIENHVAFYPPVAIQKETV